MRYKITNGDGSKIISENNISEGKYIKLNTKNTFCIDRIDIKFIPTVLDEFSWLEIDTYATAGLASSMWAVGDIKTGTYINNELRPYRIVAFNHSGDSGHITFELVLVFNNLYIKMKSSPLSSSDSWLNSDLKTTIDLLDITPDLSAAIKVTSKPCATSVTDGTQVSVSSKLWIMSEKEIHNTTTYSICKTEGIQYTYYANGGSIEKSKTKEGYEGPVAYWLRSAYGWDSTDSISFFAHVIDYITYWPSYDFLFTSVCFCI